MNGRPYSYQSWTRYTGQNHTVPTHTYTDTTSSSQTAIPKRKSRLEPHKLGHTECVLAVHTLDKLQMKWYTVSCKEKRRVPVIICQRVSPVLPPLHVCLIHVSTPPTYLTETTAASKWYVELIKRKTDLVKTSLPPKLLDYIFQAIKSKVFVIGYLGLTPDYPIPDPTPDIESETPVRRSVPTLSMCADGSYISELYLFDNDCAQISMCWTAGSNGTIDCSDCTQPSCHCHPHFFQCKSGGCIFASKLCDGVHDCEDKTDEYCLNDEPHTREEIQFTCSTGEDIPVSVVDDLVPDCPGGEDEGELSALLSGTVGRSTCTLGYLPCIPGHSRCYPERGHCVSDSQDNGYSR